MSQKPRAVQGPILFGHRGRAAVAPLQRRAWLMPCRRIYGQSSWSRLGCGRCHDEHGQGYKLGRLADGQGGGSAEYRRQQQSSKRVGS